jgi:hypothetical protein
MKNAATTFIAQVLEITPRWWRITTTAHPVWRPTASCADLLETRPKQGHAHWAGDTCRRPH